MAVHHPHEPEEPHRTTASRNGAPRSPLRPAVPTPSGIDAPPSPGALPNDDAGAGSVAVVGGRVGTDFGEGDPPSACAERYGPSSRRGAQASAASAAAPPGRRAR